MATMRRAWQPVNRRDAGDGEPDLVVDIESNVVGAGTASPPPQQTPVASSRGEGGSAQPDPWAEWYRANPDSETFSRHYGGPPLQPSSSGWNDQGWNYEQAPRQSTDQGWDDSEWDKGLKTGWLDDAQIRGFNVSNPRNTTAMNNGRWAGSYDENYQGYTDYGWGSGGSSRGDFRTNEKVAVPEFSGEGSEQDVGKSARSYVRKVQVWLRCTRMPVEQRALALYNALSDRAWAYAEELDMDILASEHGVPYYLEWIQTRFMDMEVTKISQMMGDLFRRCKKKSEQSVREFNVEFERLVLRLREVRCELPPLVKAWLYVDKLRLNEGEELALLASVGNEYDVRRLQQAAMIQDSSLRRGFGGGSGAQSHGADKRWSGKFGKHSVHMTTHEEELPSSEEDEPNDLEDDRELVEEGVAEAAHTAYMAYQGAKAKYREALKGRGVDLEEVKRRSEERLRQAKQRSYCSACKRRGHWHRDPECPLRGASKGKDGGTGEPGTHSVNMVHNVHSSFVAENSIAQPGPILEMKAILDTACTKTVAGYPWFESYYVMADNLGIPWEVIDEKDYFQFGASRIHTSEFAVRCWFAISGKWFMAKVAVVPCPVPLLFSRPVLSKLGAQYDLAAQKVTLRALNLFDLEVQDSGTGHPALLVSQFPEGPPPMSEDLQCDDVWAPVGVYMAASASSGSCPHSPLFYTKKVPLEVHNMLADGSVLKAPSFYSWWKNANQSNDFWIETDHEMIRIHVTPRKALFDPSLWKTNQASLRYALLAKLRGGRVSELIPALSEGIEVRSLADSLHEQLPCPNVGLWIGRSRFVKHGNFKPAVGPSIGSPESSLDACSRSPFSMEDEEGRTVARVDGAGSPSTHQLDSARAANSSDGDSQQPRTPIQEGGRRDEGTHQVQLAGVDEDGHRTRNPTTSQANPRMAIAEPASVEVDAGRDDRSLRQVQGVIYREVPVGYLEWAIKECKANPNHHPDLERLATWGETELKRRESKELPTKNLVADPEAMAKIPPPSLVDLRGQSSDSSWSRVSGFSPKPRVSSRRPRDQEAEESTAEEDEIAMLKTRLAVLEARKESKADVTITGVKAAPRS